ncbi:MAG: SGNH/GDSL hydrolase family protein, partial [Candidatus Dormibacteraceae bacterium]
SGSPAPITTAPIAPGPRALHVLYLGASVVEGFYASSPGATFRSRLTAMLDAQGLRVQSTAIARWGATAPTADTWDVGGPYQLAVIHMVTNDYLRAESLSSYRRAFHRLLANVRRRSPGVVVECLSDWTGGGVRNRAGISSSRYDGIVRGECAAAGGFYADISHIYWESGTRGPKGQRTPWGSSDGFHPNDRGHRRIARAVLWSLREYATRLIARGEATPAWLKALAFPPVSASRSAGATAPASPAAHLARARVHVRRPALGTEAGWRLDLSAHPDPPSPGFPPEVVIAIEACLVLLGLAAIAREAWRRGRSAGLAAACSTASGGDGSGEQDPAGRRG